MHLIPAVNKKKREPYVIQWIKNKALKSGGWRHFLTFNLKTDGVENHLASMG